MSNLIYNDKTIMGSNTSFEISLEGKEKLIYNYELRKKVIYVYLYKDMYLVKENESLLKSNDIISISDIKYINLSKEELNVLKNNYSIEIKYIKIK